MLFKYFFMYIISTIIGVWKVNMYVYSIPVSGTGESRKWLTSKRRYHIKYAEYDYFHFNQPYAGD